MNMYFKYMYITIPIYLFLVIFFKREHYIYTTGITIWMSDFSIQTQLFIDIYRYIIGLMGSISIIYIIKNSVELMPHYIKRFLAYSGQYSMQIYIIQGFIIKIYAIVLEKVVYHIGNNIFTQNYFLYNFIITPFFAIATIVVALLIAKETNKNKKISKILFGR